jgi:hypothetical protein
VGASDKDMRESMTLSRRHRRAVAALIEHATVEDAAKAAGIGTSTLRRYLADERFRATLAEAQRRVIDESFGRLASRSELAVATLEKNLTSGVHGVEVRAALGWLALLHKRGESARYARMEHELDRLSALLDERDEGEV